VSPTYANSGHSLAVNVQNSQDFAILVPLCSSANLSNLNFSAQMRIHDNGGAQTLDVYSLIFSTPGNGFTGAGYYAPHTVGTDSWFQITGGAGWPNGTESLQLSFATVSDSWNGTVYLDNIVFSP
jgi:hypothetical protein